MAPPPNAWLGFADERRVMTALEDGVIAGVIEVRRAITALEYRVLAGLLTVGLIVAFSTFGAELSHTLSNVATHL